MISASETSADKKDDRHNEEGGKLTARCDCTDVAVSLSSTSSSYSVITLKDSPNEVDICGNLLSQPEAVNAKAAEDSSEKQQKLNGTEFLSSNVSPSSADVLSAAVSPATASDVLTDHCDAGLSCVDGVAVFVDHLEQKMTLRNRAKIQIAQQSAVTYHYSPSFSCLPAIVESCRSDDAQLSDTSAASGDGYVADAGFVRSELCASSSSSPTGDQESVTHVSDETRLPGTNASAHRKDSLLSEGVSFTASSLSTAVTRDGRQLSAKSSSDGVDSAVICTPYSSQTSQDSSSTVDNTRSSCCHSVSDAVDDQPVQLIPSAGDEMPPDSWKNDEMSHATESGAARQDSDDEMSVASLKVEWEVGSDIETGKRSVTSMIGVPVIRSGSALLQRPLPNNVSSLQSLMEHSQELHRPWSGEPVAKRSCCACMSCVIMHRCVSTAAGVTPTISVRMCSSVVDVVCLVQRMIVVCNTWSKVICGSAFRLQRLHHSQHDLHNHDTAAMHSSSAYHAVLNSAVVSNDRSVDASLQHVSICEGVESIRQSIVHQMTDVSDIS